MSAAKRSAWSWVALALAGLLALGLIAVCGVGGVFLWALRRNPRPPRHAASAHAAPVRPIAPRDDYELDFFDAQTGLQWSRARSGELAWEDARSACASMRGGWRLPTRAELEAMRVDPTDGVDSPLREPLASRNHAQRLWTGEFVPGRPGHPWVMNTANGHVFNGFGEPASARCVRSP